MDLQNKKVIFIAPKFFGYDEIIERALIRNGASVYRLFDRPFSSPFLQAATKLFGILASKTLDFYYLFLIRKMPTNVDFVLVINGQTLSRNTLLTLRKRNFKAKFVLYMWDSIRNRSLIISNLDLFDTKFSFDKDSVQQYDFKFRPLFYDNLRSPRGSAENSQSFLMSFVGTAHTDRYRIIKVLAKKFSDRNCFWYLYLQAPWVFWWNKFSNNSFRGAKKSDFEFSVLPVEILTDVFDRTEIIVDIEHPNQTGLTVRTFDIMRSSKKMVTTNRDIVNYDFYMFGNIQLINRDDPQIPDAFIERKFTPYSEKILHFYSVDGWLEDVLSSI